MRYVTDILKLLVFGLVLSVFMLIIGFVAGFIASGGLRTGLECGRSILLAAGAFGLFFTVGLLLKRWNLFTTSKSNIDIRDKTDMKYEGRLIEWFARTLLPQHIRLLILSLTFIICGLAVDSLFF